MDIGLPFYFGNELYPLSLALHALFKAQTMSSLKLIIPLLVWLFKAFHMDMQFACTCMVYQWTASYNYFGYYVHW